MSSGLKFDTASIQKGLKSFENRAKSAFQTYADASALKMQDYAKTHAKWTDRSGRARTTLTGSASVIDKGFKITLAYGVEYGVWLELANEKKYAILQKTIDTVGKKQVIPGLNRLIDRLS